MTQGERIAALEVAALAQMREIQDLKVAVGELDKKIDTLLALRYKGAGAFWLFTALIGTGIIGILAKIFNVKVGM